MAYDRTSDAFAPEEADRLCRRSALLVWLSVVAVLTGLCIGAVVPAFQRLRERSRIAASKNNLLNLGLALKVYANDQDDELWLPLAPVKGLWVPDVARLSGPSLERMRNKGIYDPIMWVNPRLSDARELKAEMRRLLSHTPVDWDRVYHIIAQGYAYTNWYIPDETALDEVRELYTLMTSADYGNDIETEAAKYYRLQGQLVSILIENEEDADGPGCYGDFSSRIPAMFETTPGRADGINVMYMNGYVAFKKMGSEFPATERVMKVFGNRNRKK